VGFEAIVYEKSFPQATLIDNSKDLSCMDE
jgi:hypothetical protein